MQQVDMLATCTKHLQLVMFGAFKSISASLPQQRETQLGVQANKLCSSTLSDTLLQLLRLRDILNPLGALCMSRTGYNKRPPEWPLIKTCVPHSPVI